MHVFVNTNVNLMDRSGSGLNETSTTNVSFDVLREHAEDNLDQLVKLLEYVATFVSSNEKGVAAVFKSANSGKSDLRDQLAELGFSLEQLGLTKQEAAKLIGLATAIVAMPNDPRK